jgi:5,10-methylenetetrahydrofolate reductase
VTFKEALDAGKFVVTSEVGPPKGTDIKEMLHHAELLKGKVHGVNVTDNQSAVMRIGSLAVSKLMLDMGHDPIFQMTCRDRNRIAIQSDLLGAAVLGIRNVLCMTGDHPNAGDHKQAKPVYDIESVQLLKVVESLNSGKDMAGNEMLGSTNFFKGCVVTPEANPLKPQLIKFGKKLRAGAQFVQTQAIYDIEHFKEFMKTAREAAQEANSEAPAKILAGIVLLKSAGMANYLNKFVPGIKVPENLINELKEAGKGKGLDAGINIAARHIRQLHEEKICDGVHIMAIGAEQHVPEIMQRAGLL